MKPIIVDFDGTLVDSTAALVAAWNTIAQKHQWKDISLKDIEALKKLSLMERSKLLNLPIYKVPLVLPQFYQLYRQALQDIRPFKGMKKVLLELHKRGFKIMIISSHAKDTILAFLKLNDIHCVAEVLCSNPIAGKDKAIEKFIKKSTIPADEMLYIGDEYRDSIACKKVSVPIIWVGWGYEANEAIQHSKPDYQAAAPQDIIKIIDSL
ncbi:HAD hydrolase-like protein [Lysinibacillus macroides]|uniref:HAD family hydrolase n=1 Tax=Lysinibacillus macroides TaxID=33935 RepID=A0A0N0UX32_9BACI|nr:HAD hydrolase-like protein [Lysinibacillus macroides]KOY83134.1 HAD family hydrolase [Lysinibacillus macroides]QPR70005.1 HAD hydrolase-like protein [Lysinibacillus macroides]